VLLTGDGADEFFAGYETYRATRLAGLAGAIVPRGAAHALSHRLLGAGSATDKRIGPAEKAGRFLAGLAHGNGRPHPQWRRYLYPGDMPGLYGPAMREMADIDPLGAYAAAFGGKGSLLDRALEADQRYYLPGDMLMKADAMSMAHGVEVRVPFLDRRIMEFANSLAPNLLSPLRGPDKRVLRAALRRRGLSPETTTARKRGFNVPVGDYLRKQLRPLAERLLDREADVLAPFLDADGVRRHWRGFVDGTNGAGYTIWTLLTLASWRQSQQV
jgi:asparagine synthase (glutamine-hydrolysing)